MNTSPSMSISRLAASLVALALLSPATWAAQKKTVCTITVNSADEKDTFRQRLPKGDYEFVELVEKGRPDWLRSSCTRNVQCDVLVISGHFNAGDTFYSDQLDRHEYLEIDELERASCSGSCPGVFSKLKEVYLFGCESLNPDATKYASAYGESGRDRMRRIFAGVPVIYGFSSSAPVGPTAGMLINRYFDAGGGDFASGRPNARLLKVFSRNNMVHVPGAREGDSLSASRREICQFFDERKSPAEKVRFIQGLLRAEGGAERHFNRVEKLFGSFGETQRHSAGFGQALAEISVDEAARARFLEASRRASQPTTRSRMIALGAGLGWLTPDQERGEQVALVNDMLSRGSVGFAEVDLVCSMNREGALSAESRRIAGGPARAGRAAQAAVMACLGNREARGQMIRALASADEREVQLAQAYLRHHPAEPAELRGVARDIAQMGQGTAQVRALDTLARMHIADREILEELSRAFAETKSVHVQRAIAEVFIRSDTAALPRRSLIATLRDHRLKPPGGGLDLVDSLIARLQAAG